jgi:D-sedoheptulose 7-phosphate isomerase
MHKFEEILKENKSAEGFTSEYVSYLSSILARLDRLACAQVCQILEQAREQKNAIFICGNGGSAATASHIAEDLALGPKKYGHTPFRTISLTDNVASITAIGNDNGYEEIFLMQLENLFRKGDIVMGISASGNSPNVIKALEYANANGGISVALTGFDGGKMKKISRYGIHIQTGPGEYEPVEDAHLIIGHILASYFKYRPRNTTLPDKHF